MDVSAVASMENEVLCDLRMGGTRLLSTGSHRGELISTVSWAAQRLDSDYISMDFISDWLVIRTTYQGA